jgi:molybdopterin/thiamine biosynthesis adenylyltransferase
MSRLEEYLRASQSFTAGDGSVASPPMSPTHRRGDVGATDFDRQCLAGQEIVLFGAGSVGSYLAHFLAIARLILHVIDFKRVEEKHLREGRTAYRGEDLGLLKVDALKRRLESDYPGIRVQPYPCDVAQFTDTDLTAMFQQCVIAILAIDDPEQMIRVADLAYPLVQLLQVAMHRRGHSSHIIVSVPHVTPCLRCTLGISSPREIRRLDSELSSSGDIVTLANTAANFALDLACSKVTGQHITRWDVSKNRIYLANRRDGAVSPDGPGLHYERVQRRWPGCPICNNRTPS